ncbi:MAG: PrsW family glutamic-type intramembrane protease [bacterium]|nr:PrsW family glutamic-type intramembrane protease [bacterium]
MTNPETILWALLGGILPALLWLFFWLREDRKHPEPRGLIGKTFFFGMLAVVFVLPFQKGVEMLFPDAMVMALFLWAVFEELFKLAAGYFGGLHSVEDNEPIDPIIYMITAALGFVALENTLFILGPLLGEDIPGSIITGNLRFIGASLLHVLSSGFVGVSLAFSFYKARRERFLVAFWALCAAIVFHTAFNLLILNWGDFGTMISFVSVWIGIALLLLAFERAKSIARQES